MQRKKFAGTSSPIPVPMLVPNPSTDAKVFIGDREADDTTDLSDAASDYDDDQSESESAPSLETILVKSKTVIGGKNGKRLPCDDVVDGFVSHNENDGAITEARNKCVATKIHEDGGMKSFCQICEAMLKVFILEHESLTSLESNTEQDTEYTEKYATLPRTILKSPEPQLR